MLLSQFIFKQILVKENARGFSVGVGISLKNYAVKYLLCNSGPVQKNTLSPLSQSDFAVAISSLSAISPTALTLSSLRPVFPKSCAKILLGKPVYLQTGEFLGTMQNLEITHDIATRIFTEKGAFSTADIFSVGDAVILKKSSPYPLGQRIPAPASFDFLTEKDALITKKILKVSLEKSELIRLTLSLPPFCFTL